MNALERARKDPQSLYYDVMEAMLPYGVEAPVNDEGEVDVVSYLTLIAMAADDLMETMEGNQLRIYRSLIVGDGWEPESVGVHWARRIGMAHAYNGAADQGTEIVLEGLVDIADIDLAASLVLNMDLTEEEVLLRYNSPVKIVGAWTKDGARTHEHLEGRTFFADIGNDPEPLLTPM